MNKPLIETEASSPLLERNVLALGLTSMIATFGNYTWVFFLPIYYNEHFGASIPLIGLIYTSWFLVIGIGAAPAGALADRYGRKPIVVMAGLISSAAVFLLAFSNNFILSAIALPLSGLGTSFLQVSNVIVAESVQAKKRGSAFGSFQTLTYALPSISSIIGGISLFNNPDYFFPLFVFGGTLALVATLGRAFFVRETLRGSDRNASQEMKTSYFAAVGKIFRNRVLLVLILVYSFYNLILDQSSYIIPLYGKFQLSLDPVVLGILFAIITFISAIARLPFGKLADRIGRQRTILISWIGESLAVYVFVFAPHGALSIALAGISLWSLFGVMDGPAVNAWLADATDAKSRGLSMGTFYSASFLVSVPFFALAGFLYAINAKLPFYANSILGIFALVALIALSTNNKASDTSQQST